MSSTELAEDDHEGIRATDPARTAPAPVPVSTDVRPLPLTSRRVTIQYLKQLAGELGLPEDTSASDVGQHIEGAIQEMGREPRNVQVVLQETETGMAVSLQDEQGVFLTAEPREAVTERPPVQQGTPDSEEERDGDELHLEVQSLRLALEAANTEINELRVTIITLTEQVEKEKKRAKDLWHINCAQLAEFNSTLALKEDEVEVLQRELSGLRSHSTSPIDIEHTAHPLTHSSQPLTAVPTRRRGKAPPIDAFTGEDPETRFDDWLPSLRRAAEWNAWEPDELLLQLVGHLRGHALQEYNLLDCSTPRIFDDVVEALQARLDPGGKAMAAQDFRHASHGKGESMSDFVRRLERIFRVACCLRPTTLCCTVGFKRVSARALWRHQPSPGQPTTILFVLLQRMRSAGRLRYEPEKGTRGPHPRLLSGRSER